MRHKTGRKMLNDFLNKQLEGTQKGDPSIHVLIVGSDVGQLLTQEAAKRNVTLDMVLMLAIKALSNDR